MSTENLVSSTVAAVAMPVRPEQLSARCLHCEPPLTPARFFALRPRLRTMLAVIFALLAAAAWVGGGAMLLTWDEPIQRAVEASRTDITNDVFRTVSFLGSTTAVLSLGCVLAALAWRRCRAVGIVVLLAMLSRPLLEFTLKAIVDRDRPDLERLVAGNGPSFPSGHVMAAVALWGLVPLVVTLYTRDRRIWWASVAGSTRADPRDRSQPHLPGGALVLGRGRWPGRRHLLPAGSGMGDDAPPPA